jgi:hypothetical protein
MKAFYLATQLQAKLIEFGIWLVDNLKKYMMLSLMKQMALKTKKKTWMM